MGENSKIEWCHHTFNPWIGCTKVGPPCDNCYAESMSNRYGWVTWGPHGERKRTSEANWRNPLQWQKAAAAAGVRQRVFCASLADWLDNQVDPNWRNDLWGLIVATPNLDWLLLSKRIQNYAKLAPWDVGEPPPNVWLGITCGDQKEYDRDWPKLAALTAKVRFISYEPALGPLRISHDFGVPDWVICGGESGHNARPMHPDWARSLRDQCLVEEVSFFFKQWGEYAAIEVDDRDINGNYTTRLVSTDGRHVSPKELADCDFSGRARYVYRVGKKRAGRLLDGVEHNGFPQV